MLKIDLHIHTIASGHAYNTILEYINRAKELGMTTIGISDHAENVPGTLVNDIYFTELKRVPRWVDGITVLRGVEANIMTDGGIDISERVAKELDYVMAGLHRNQYFQDQGREANTEQVIKAIKSGRIKIMTHPYLNSRLDFDVEAVAEAACLSGVLLEVNVSTFEFNYDESVIGNLKAMLAVVRRHGKKVVVNSDSHTIWQLADETLLDRVRDEIGLTDAMVINNYPEELFGYLNIKL